MFWPVEGAPEWGASVSCAKLGELNTKMPISAVANVFILLLRLLRNKRPLMKMVSEKSAEELVTVSARGDDRRVGQAAAFPVIESA
jgi:hypothetical protein